MVMVMGNKRMGLRRHISRLLWMAIGLCLWPAMLQAQARAIDTGHSTLTVRVSKTGIFSGFAHDHEIEAPIVEGTVALDGNLGVSLRVDARKMRVLDPDASEQTRAQVQNTMQGSSVLDSTRFPEISFLSSSVEAADNDRWNVRGNLTLHGQTMPVGFEATLTAGHYRGTATVRQTDFGIVPIRIAGGTVKVKDQVKIEFDIVLAGAMAQYP
jgi:polyisoprenoid-binding protein YceI